MKDRTPNLESYEEGGSITGRKIRTNAENIDLPTKDDGLLSPYRDDEPES